MRKVLVGVIVLLLVAAGAVYFWPVPTVQQVCAGTPEWCREFRELINEVIINMEYARNTHVHWLQFLKENPDWDTMYVGDSDRQLEWIKKYDHVLEILDSCSGLPSSPPTEIDEAIANMQIARDIHKRWALILEENSDDSIEAKIGNPQYHWGRVSRYSQVIEVLYRCGGPDRSETDREWHKEKVIPPVFLQSMHRWEDGPTMLATIIVTPPGDLWRQAGTILVQEGFGVHGLIASVLILSRSPDGSELSYPTAWGKVEMEVHDLSSESNLRKYEGWGPSSILVVRYQRK